MLHAQIQSVFLYYNLYLNTIIPFSPDAPVDSIIAWEKLFRTGITKRNNNTHSIPDKSADRSSLNHRRQHQSRHQPTNQIYQKAREMDYPLGTALALHAIGNTYLSSSTPQVAIKSYKEALEIIQKLPSCQPIYQNDLVPIYPDEAQLSPNDRYRRQYPGTRICYQQGYESPRRFPPCLLSGILSHPDASSSGSIKLYTTNRTNQPATPVPIFSFND